MNGILKLVEKGKLKLDDPLKKYIPEINFKNLKLTVPDDVSEPENNLAKNFETLAIPDGVSEPENILNIFFTTSPLEEKIADNALIVFIKIFPELPIEPSKILAKNFETLVIPDGVSEPLKNSQTFLEISPTKEDIPEISFEVFFPTEPEEVSEPVLVC